MDQQVSDEANGNERPTSCNLQSVESAIVKIQSLYIYIYTYIFIHTYIYTYIFTYTYIYMYISIEYRYMNVILHLVYTNFEAFFVFLLPEKSRIVSVSSKKRNKECNSSFSAQQRHDTGWKFS